MYLRMQLSNFAASNPVFIIPLQYSGYTGVKIDGYLLQNAAIGRSGTNIRGWHVGKILPIFYTGLTFVFKYIIILLS